MIRIDSEPWAAMVSHARKTYPNECCGAMLGVIEDGVKTVHKALPLENAFAGAQAARYELRPEDLLAADRAARARNMDLIGIYHSHPDCDAYFSETFFFFQAEDGIRDGHVTGVSDVCSSDLTAYTTRNTIRCPEIRHSTLPKPTIWNTA